MNTLNVLPLIWLLQTVLGLKSSPRRDLPFQELATYDGYNSEQHFVTTQDGYILGVYRIPLKEDCVENKGTIMFMHGLYLSGDDCLVPGPGKAHCYIYADSCYDVWVPNVRGNFYSRNHTTYNPDKDSKFWDFSIDEMAMYDLPAVIDYVLDTTNSTQLTYVAHSQGVALLLILCAKMPEYNSKIKVGIGLSSTAWLDHARFAVVQFQGIATPILSMTGGLLSQEVLKRHGLVQGTGRLLCGFSTLSYPLCSYIIFAALGYNEYQITSDVLPVVVGHTPSGTSLKNFNRWGQVKKNGFSEYDHGSIKNLFVYGRLSPPIYDVSRVTMRWEMISSLNDYVGDVRDIKLLVSKLPNASMCVLADETFGHLDFIYGKDVPNITRMVLSIIANGTYECT